MLTGPFVFVGALNFCIFLFAIIVRLKSPGMAPEEIKAMRAARMAAVKVSLEG
jgi:hypothetical protein